MSNEVTCKTGLTESEKSRLFWASFLGLAAAGVGFVFRSMVPQLWETNFAVTSAEVGQLFGASLWPIAITMILFSLLVDKIGYKISMFSAFALQALSVVLTIKASSFDQMWWACICAGLGHGIVEAVINPLCATMYRDQKSKMLNILHASWPAGIVAGAVVWLTVYNKPDATWANSSSIFWLMLIPVLGYGILFAMCKKFPVDERVEANVPMKDMLKEFGGLGAFIAITFLSYEICNQTGTFQTDVYSFSHRLIACLCIGSIGGAAFGFAVGSKGKWLFFILCLIMIPLATAEIATDGWIIALMKPALGEHAGWALVLSAGIMMVLRFFAGIPLKFMSPPGLLLLSSCFSIVGLFALSSATDLTMIIGAFVLYAVGQTFYWPTVLGFVAEQFPKGGAITLNTVSAMGLLTVGIFGFPFLGAVQASHNAEAVAELQPALYETIKTDKVTFGEADDKKEIYAQGNLFGVKFETVNTDAVLAQASLSADDKATLEATLVNSGRKTLKVAAILPTIMAIAFLLMIIYYKSQGGYKAVSLSSDEDNDTDNDGVTASDAQPLQA